MDIHTSVMLQLSRDILLMIACSATNLFKGQLAAGRSLNNAFCRGGCRDRSCPRSATASQLSDPPFQLGGGHATIVLIWPPIFSFKALALFREG